MNGMQIIPGIVLALVFSVTCLGQDWSSEPKAFFSVEFGVPLAKSELAECRYMPSAIKHSAKTYLPEVDPTAPCVMYPDDPDEKVAKLWVSLIFWPRTLWITELT